MVLGEVSAALEGVLEAPGDNSGTSWVFLGVSSSSSGHLGGVLESNVCQDLLGF